MKYYKNVAGSVVMSERKPAGAWREVSAREYAAYRAYVTRMMEGLEKAVSAKARMLGVS